MEDDRTLASYGVPRVRKNSMMKKRNREEKKQRSRKNPNSLALL